MFLLNKLGEYVPRVNFYSPTPPDPAVLGPRGADLVAAPEVQVAMNAVPTFNFGFGL